jgi:hypothetical protein
MRRATAVVRHKAHLDARLSAGYAADTLIRPAAPATFSQREKGPPHDSVICTRN